MNMTTRDYLAAMAMQGELAAQNEHTGEWTPSSYSELSARAYKIADAMIEESNRTLEEKLKQAGVLKKTTEVEATYEALQILGRSLSEIKRGDTVKLTDKEGTELFFKAL